MAQWKNQNHQRGWFVILLLLAVANLAVSFEWKSDTFKHVTGCVGSKVMLPFEFLADSRESIETIYWSKGLKIKNTIASLYRGRFKPEPGKGYLIQRAPDMNAGLVLDRIKLDDTGYYDVTVTVLSKDEEGDEMKTEHRASALLTVVGEAPSVFDDVVEVKEVTSEVQACARKGTITLSCGNFTSRGSPPVEVVWTDPAGQVFPSTRFSDGYFDLDLPSRPLPGNYSCNLSCKSPLLQCLPPSSPLLGKHRVHVTPPSNEGCETTSEGQGQVEVTDDESEARREEDYQELLQNITKLQEVIESLQAENVELKEEAQIRRDQNYNNLMGAVQKLAGKVDVMDHTLAGLTKTTQCNVTEVDLSPFEERFEALENSLNTRAQGDQAVEELETDPLVSRLRPTFSLTSPVDAQSKSVMEDVVITPRGAVVMTDRYQSHVIVAENRPESDVTTRPLKFGTYARQLTNMNDGVVAATVDDAYIYILDTTTTRERWIRTKEKYYGLAARSEQTLFASVTARDAGEGHARIDVITIHDVSAVVVTSLLNQTTAKKLNNPKRLTVNDNHLYIVDGDVIMRLDLDTHELSVMTGPRSRPDLSFFQPRDVALDSSGNMYLATGGHLCNGKVAHLYSHGFCVVVISREGSWRKLTSRGKDIYPYGVTLTPTGVAVTWVSWVQAPVRSLVQFYDLVPPRG